MSVPKPSAWLQAGVWQVAAGGGPAVTCVFVPTRAPKWFLDIP